MLEVCKVLLELHLKYLNLMSIFFFYFDFLLLMIAIEQSGSENNCGSVTFCESVFFKVLSFSCFDNDSLS